MPHRNGKAEPWLTQCDEVSRHALRLVPGAVWRFKGIALADGRCVRPPGLYRVLAVAQHERTWQEMVVYVAEDGRERGNVFCCCLRDFAENFDPPTLPVEKVAGYTSQGSGA